MRPFVDPSDLSAEQRLDELAAILAKGIERLEDQPGESGIEMRSFDETSPESRRPGLELSGTSRLTVTP